MSLSRGTRPRFDRLSAQVLALSAHLLALSAHLLALST
jgi:hypothetical protein